MLLRFEDAAVASAGNQDGVTAGHPFKKSAAPTDDDLAFPERCRETQRPTMEAALE